MLVDVEAQAGQPLLFSIRLHEGFEASWAKEDRTSEHGTLRREHPLTVIQPDPGALVCGTGLGLKGPQKGLESRSSSVLAPLQSLSGQMFRV